jgi:ferredoxin
MSQIIRKESKIMMPFVNNDKCTGCDICIEFCPVDAVIKQEGKAYISVDCVECGACIDECPEGAISIEEE